MGDVGDYWREARDHRRRAKSRLRKDRCVCGHLQACHEDGRCDRYDTLGLPCMCRRFESEASDAPR